MKHATTYFLLLSLLVLVGCSATKDKAYQRPKDYKPNDPALYDTIAHLDSVFFGAYNTCAENMDLHASFYSDSIEFFHDGGGLTTSKEQILEATRRNICGKVTRELVKGSLEVYPIKNYGAVEIGWHRFRNNTEPAGTPSVPGRFLIIWKQEPGGWKITRVVSLH